MGYFDNSRPICQYPANNGLTIRHGDAGTIWIRALGLHQLTLMIWVWAGQAIAWILAFTGGGHTATGIHFVTVYTRVGATARTGAGP